MDREDEASNQGFEFKLERYKFILAQIQRLDDSLYKYLNLFQTLVTAIIGGSVALLVGWKNLKVDAETARVGIYGLLGLLCILALFFIVNVIVGILSWLDYRKDETELLNEAMGSDYRKPPRIRNCWRWYETYFIVFLVILIVAAIWFVNQLVIPLID